MLTKKQYPDWTSLIVDAYHHGMAHMMEEHLEHYMDDLRDDLRSSFLRGSDTPAVRPSGAINCAAMTALVAEGFGAAEDPRDLPRALFATGHFHHNLLYAALSSALPLDAIKLTIEEVVDLTPLGWWPHPKGFKNPRFGSEEGKGKHGWEPPSEYLQFKQNGHIDLQLECLDDGWLGPDAPRRIVADVKTKHSLGMAKTKDIVQPANDVWGNIDQLAVYSALKGTTENGALLIYVNREVPKAIGKRIKAQYIFPQYLEEARANVERRLASAINGEFDPELWLRKQAGSKEFMPCQGYCDVQAECERRREGMEV